jgi:hypothetical protein
MRSIFYGVYLFGAVMGSVAMWLLDPVTALIATMTIPLVVLWGAELFGFIHFHRVELEDDDDDLLVKIREENLSDKEAIDKYGQQIINEVDRRVGMVEAQLANMKRQRNEMIRMMKEER